ncbi:uncharacterized protein LOC116618852 [Nematostella vectensis]|uniref:uncharacterized protein LOC116618852 n=1 Tax=Nematostella vectensis TaxID=45351 RepID=UPI002077296E|nr:uncharacterized protein LOC116618852 [Nematostella vectensis]
MADSLVVFFVVLVNFYLFYSLAGTNGVTLETPKCIVYGMPPHMLLSSKVSSGSPLDYCGLYCHPSGDSKYCRDPSTGYKPFCSFNSTVGKNAVRCNLTDIVRDLYPSLVDPTQKDKVKGYKLCVRVRASNGSSLTYSDKECCSVLAQSKCTSLKNFKVQANGQGRLHVGWDAPDDMGSMKYFLKYWIYYSTEGDKENRSIAVLASPSGSYNSINLTGLQPNTLYSIYGTCSFVSFMDDSTTGGLVQGIATTLEQAPSAAPAIVDYYEIDGDEEQRTVQLLWKHPPPHHRNGVIRQSVVTYWAVPEEVSNNTSIPKSAMNVNVKGAVNESQIQGLAVHIAYHVVVRTCTTDCGPLSEVFEIGVRQDLSTPLASTAHGPWVLPVFLCLAVAVVISIIIIGICLAFKRSRRRSSLYRNRSHLPSDVLPSSCQSSPSKHGVSTQPILEEEGDYNEANVQL